jgi:hypothetical protein
MLNVEETKNSSSRISNSLLAKPILLPNGSEDETPRLPNNHEDKPEILPSRMAIIDQGRRQSGITNEKSVKYLQNLQEEALKKHNTTTDGSIGKNGV